MAMAAGRAGLVSSPRRSQNYWQAQVEAQRRSGLSQIAFCRRRGLRKGTFSFWKWKLTKVTRAARAGHGRGTVLALRSAATAAFVPVQLAAHQASAPVTEGPEAAGEIEITLGRDRGVRVRGPVDPAWLLVVLRGVEALGC
jgi:hypothetical protein